MLHLLLLHLHPTLQMIITELSSITGRHWSCHSTTESSLSFYVWVGWYYHGGGRILTQFQTIWDKIIDGDKVHSVRLEFADPFVQFISSFHQKIVAQLRTSGGNVKQTSYSFKFFLKVNLVLKTPRCVPLSSRQAAQPPLWAGPRKIITSSYSKSKLSMSQTGTAFFWPAFASNVTTWYTKFSLAWFIREVSKVVFCKC